MSWRNREWQKERVNGANGSQKRQLQSSEQEREAKVGEIGKYNRCWLKFQTFFVGEEDRMIGGQRPRLLNCKSTGTLLWTGQSTLKTCHFNYKFLNYILVLLKIEFTKNKKL